MDEPVGGGTRGSRFASAMGNINFAASNRDLATTPLEAMNAQLFLGAKIDVIVIAAIALIAMLTRGTESDANFIVAWLIVAFTAVDMVLLCLMTRPRRERDAEERRPPHALTGMAILTNAVALALTVTRDLLTIHEHSGLAVKACLLVVFALLIVNKACLLVVLVVYTRRVWNEEKAPAAGSSLNEALIVDGH